MPDDTERLEPEPSGSLPIPGQGPGAPPRDPAIAPSSSVAKNDSAAIDPPSQDDGAARSAIAGLEQELLTEILTLNERVWERRVSRQRIEQWVANFERDDAQGAGEPPQSEAPSKRLHALYLLSRFMYFGDPEVRALLRVLFRDLYRYPIVEATRRALADTTDVKQIERFVHQALLRTRFIGVGNPSESGQHLLYHFRQENRLPTNLFISAHQIVDRTPGQLPALREPEVTRYVFLDDFCGSAQQAVTYARQLVHEVKAISARDGLGVSIAYYVLVATSWGLELLREGTAFDEVRPVLELDRSFRCFGEISRYFRNAPGEVDAVFAHDICYYFGRLLESDHPLGYRNSQLLLGFHHNTPDNALPVFWHSGTASQSWQPIFYRYPKSTLSALPGVP